MLRCGPAVFWNVALLFLSADQMHMSERYLLSVPVWLTCNPLSLLYRLPILDDKLIFGR